MSITSIRTSLIQGIVGAALGVPVKWPNASFTTPLNSLWVRATLMAGIPSEITQNTDRVDGLLYIDVFAPSGSGTVAAYAIADKLNAAFPRNGDKTGALYFRSVSAPNAIDDNVMQIQCRWYGFFERT